MTKTTPMADQERVNVSFSLTHRGAGTVCLAVFHNDWSPLSDRELRRPWRDREPPGPPMVQKLVRMTEVQPTLWRCEVLLQPGWCEYLFLVGSNWLLDPTALDKCPDGDGDYSSTRWIETVAHPGVHP